MAGVNKVIIVGRLGSDPDLQQTQTGKSYCRLSVATTRTWRHKQTNEKMQETEWHRVTAWDRQAENCASYLEKGREVYVEGRLRTHSYDKDGQKHYSTEIIAEQIQFLGGGQSSGNNEKSHSASNSDSSSQRSRRAPVDDLGDDDIPF